MSDDAYIPPSEREPESHALGERFAQWSDQWDLLNTIAASHAVVDSVAADLAAAARKGMNAAAYAQQEYGSRRSEYPADSSEREAYDRAYSKASDAFEHCWAALRRYDALHKDAGQ